MRPRSGKYPLYDLISMRYDFQAAIRDGENTPEINFLAATPTLEKQQFSKFTDEVKQGKDPEQALKNYGYTFPFDLTEIKAILKAKERFRTNLQIYTTIICLYTLGFTSNPSNYNIEDSFETIVDLLNRINNNTDYSKIVNLCFKKILDCVLAKENKTQLTPGIIQPVVVHFYTNTSLENDFYDYFVSFLEAVASSSCDDCARDSQLLLEQIVVENRQLIRVDDFNTLLSYLHKFTTKLDSNCVRILCRLSKLYNFRNILNEIYILPECVYDKVIASINQPLFTSDYANTPIINTDKLPPYTSIVVKNDINPFFEEPPFSKVQSTVNVFKEYIPKKIFNIAIDIGESLQQASYNAIEIVLQALIHKVCTSQDPNISISIYGVFFLIFRKAADLNLIKLLIPTIMSSFVMSPAMTIFGNSDLHPFINGLRSAFIDFVIENDVDELPDVVEMTENTPILLAEVLVRVMNIQTMDAHKFVSPKMLKVLGQNLVNLCQTKYELLYQPRSALFTFVFKLFKNIDLAWKCFTCENFVSLFLSLSLETDLTETIFFAVRDALTNFDSSYDANQLNPLIDWFYKTIQFCVNEAKSDIYLHYLQVIIKTMADCFGEQPWLSISFRPILKLLLDILEVRPDRLILENAIKLLSAIERTVDKFYLNRSLFARLVKVIKLVDKDEPSTRIELLLMSLLSGYSAMTTKTRFYIKEPSVIPLIIAVFGQSSRFVDILKTFKQLCDYTAFNCRQFHDGDLDWILMTYISQKKEKTTFKYRNVDISISLEHGDIEKYILPLISSMAISKSSTAISTIMANYISTDVDQHSFDFCNYLDILLGKCAITPTKTFSMNTSPDPQFSVQGIFGEDLNKGFTISLRLNIDTTPMTASNASISLFTITDDDCNLFRCFLSAGHIFMKYEADCTRTSVILAKNVPSQQWTLYTIIVRMDGQMVKLSTFENNQSLNDSDLCEFTFNPTKLEFVVGGLNEPMENSQWDDIQMGEFGDLNLYTELLTQVDINVLYSQPWNFAKVPLFSTASIPTPGLKSTVTAPRKRIAVNSSLFSNYIENLTINVSDCKTPSLHLLDNMVDGDYGNILAGFFRQEHFFNNEYPPLILGLIKSIFKRSLKSQIGFTSLLTMTTNLSQHPMILNSELYLALYHVFEAIKYDVLHFQWFTKLVFNFWLWVNCENFDDLFFILQHWHSILLPNLTDLIKQKSFFSVLLSQYKMILCFDKEDEALEKIEDLHYEHSINIMKYFTKGYTVKNVLSIRDLFVKIMKRTAFINFTSSDFRNLFSLLTTSKTRTTSLIMLDIILNITKPILQTKMVSHKYNAILEEFVKSDNLEIVKSAIICLHSISYQNMIEYSQQISENINRDLKPHVFGFFVNNLQKYPNLYNLLIILSIELNEMENLATKIGQTIKSPDLYLCPDWFLWPVVLCYNISKEYLNFIVLFICQVIEAQKENASLYFNVFSFIKFIDDALAGCNKEVLVLFTKTAAYTIMSKAEVTSYVILSIFSSFFFHSAIQTHSNNLVEMYMSSPFGNEKFESLQKVPTQISSLKNIGDVLALSNYDIDTVKLFYECKTDKHNFVQSNFLDEMINAHNSFEFNSGDIMFFNYMIGITKQNNLIPNDQRNQLLNTSVEFFDKILSLFEVKYKNSLKKTFASMNSMLNSQNKFVEEMTINHFDDYKKDGNNIIVNEFENSLKDFCNMITSMTALVKDKTYSYNFCQLKKKRTTEKKFKTVPQITDQTLTYKVFLIKGKNILQSEFHICKDKILVVYSYSYKEIKFNRITYVFARQNVKGEVNNLEIYTVDGKSYLFDFISIDSQTVIKSLPKNLMNNLKFMTVSFKQKDLFSGLNLTNLWEISTLSTFDYIMLINIFSGRTFNNAPEMQPIFPPILSDFKIFGCVYDFTKTVDVSSDFSIESISKMKNVNARVYFDPTLPGNLPNWSKDRYDFISHIRKLLESHGTSKLIPKWIDQNFGKEMSKKNSKHKQVFSKLHPQRQNVLKMITKNYKRQLNTSSKNKILFTSCNLTETAENSIVLSFFLSNNTLTTINCLLSDDFKVVSTNSVETMDITPNSSFSATEKSLVLYTPEKRQAVVYNRENKVQGSYVLYCETNMISYYENSFLFCPDFCTISILDETNPKPTVLTHSPCRLSSLASSNKYKIFAYGTIDGHVCVYSLSMSKSNFVNKTPIVEEAEHIVITNNYGFIVCSTATKFIVMSVNGEIIREFTHNKEIVNLFSFDCLGTDFIAFVTNDNKVGYFEAFHPENAINFLQIREHIELVTYNYATATFIVITNESIRFIPYSNIV